MLSHLLPQPEERRWVLRWGLVALVLHLLASLLTEGWNHVDEHYQVLEFTNAMLGKSPREHLAWEYEARIRPALQPAVYALMAKGASVVGIENPFTLSTLFRVFSAIVAWGSTMALGLAALRSFGTASPLRRWVFPTLALAWFLPYLHARTSSENLSEACFLAGTALLWWRLGNIEGRAGSRQLDLPSALTIGLLYGLAFEFRYQTGIMVAGAGLWCLLVRRLSFRPILFLSIGLLSAIALGTMVDRWFYGEWVFAPWNYLRVNLFENKANSFGVSPWYAYLPWMLERAAPPLSVLLLGGVFWTWARRPLSLLTWSTVLFVLLHMALAHKEVRFLFPIATLSLVLMLQALDDHAERLLRWSARPLFRATVRVLVVANCVCLAIASLRPAQHVISLFKEVYARASTQRSMELYFDTHNPYSTRIGVPIDVYRPPNFSIATLYASPGVPKPLPSDFWMVSPTFDVPKPVAALGMSCTPEYRTMPDWIRKVDFNGWVERAGVWTLFRCQPPVASKQ